MLKHKEVLDVDQTDPINLGVLADGMKKNGDRENGENGDIQKNRDIHNYLTILAPFILMALP